MENWSVHWTCISSVHRSRRMRQEDKKASTVEIYKRDKRGKEMESAYTYAMLILINQLSKDIREGVEDGRLNEGDTQGRQHGHGNGYNNMPQMQSR